MACAAKAVLIVVLPCVGGAVSLKDCNTVFLQPMPESLARLIAIQLTKWGGIQLAPVKERADCVATFGRESDRISARLGGNAAVGELDKLPIHFNGFGYTNSAGIEIVHRESSFLVWSDSKSDMWSLAGGPKTLARRLVRQLKSDYKQDR